MSKAWTFIGGVLAGVVGVFATAAVAVEMEGRKSGSDDTGEAKEKLALPEGDGEQAA